MNETEKQNILLWNSNPDEYQDDFHEWLYECAGNMKNKRNKNNLICLSLLVIGCFLINIGANELLGSFISICSDEFRYIFSSLFYKQITMSFPYLMNKLLIYSAQYGLKTFLVMLNYYCNGTDEHYKSDCLIKYSDLQLSAAKGKDPQVRNLIEKMSHFVQDDNLPSISFYSEGKLFDASSEDIQKWSIMINDAKQPLIKRANNNS